MNKEMIKSIFKKMVRQKNRIYLESKPPFSDNSYDVYRELLRRRLNGKYEIMWIYDGYDKYNSSVIPDDLPENVSVVEFKSDTLMDKLKKEYHLLSGKAYLMSNATYFGHRENQINIYLGHGAPFKRYDGYGIDNKRCSYGIALSSKVVSLTAVDENLQEEQIIPTGFPRNDYFGHTDKREIWKKCGFDRFDKVIVWMPTIRKRWNSDKQETDVSYYGGIPLIESEEDLIEINRLLAELNYLLVIKMHFAQDNSTVLKTEYSNISIATNKELEKWGVQLNELLATTDGLITDYSSVYFDYLLNDKPIGLVINDLDEYSRKPGLLFSFYESIFGDYLYDMGDLRRFISTTVRTDDLSGLKDAKRKYHDYFDGHSSERLVDFLEEQLREMGKK